MAAVEDRRAKTPSAMPERDASCCARLTFSWLTPLMRVGSQRVLDRGDVWQTHARDGSAEMTERLEELLLREETVHRTPPGRRLLHALARLRGCEWLCCAGLKFTGEAVAYLQPVILSALLQHIEERAASTSDTTAPTTWLSSESPYYPFLLSLALIVIMLFRTFIMAFYVNLTCRISLTRRTAFMGVVMRKALSIPSTVGHKSTGALLNIVGNDAEKMSLGSRLSQNFWFQPVAVVICMSLLVYYIGYAAFVGLGVMLLLLPIQVMLARRLTRLRRTLLKESDARVGLVSDLIQGVRAIKLLVWMPFVLKKIAVVRRKELQRLRSYLLISMLNYLFLTMVPILIASLTFVAFVALGNEIKASTAFTALSLLGMLRGPLFMFPRVLNAVLDGLVGVERASRLLTMETFARQRFAREKKAAELGHAEEECGILVDAEHFSWGAIPRLQMKSTKGKGTTSTDQDPVIMPHLANISLKVNRGELALVVGSVGSGKSTLLYSLLGECPSVVNNASSASKPKWALADDAQTSRRRVVNGTVAFVPQVPFIFIATARDNILFGKPFKAKLYAQVVDACALLPDFELFPSGDATEIGERGINLSGGQKMRLSLARALYADADVYLLDDPLAAVDADVAAHIWNRGIQRFLRKRGKVVLMTTNNVNYLSCADRMFLLEKQHTDVTANGSEMLRREENTADNNVSAIIAESGTPAEVRFQGAKLAGLLDSVDPADVVAFDDGEAAAAVAEAEEQEVKYGFEATATNTVVASVDDGDSSNAMQQHTGSRLAKGKLVSTERQEKGMVKKRTWIAYFDAVGLWMCALILVLYAFREAAKVGMDVWMAQWSDATTTASVPTINDNSTLLSDENVTTTQASAAVAMSDSDTLFYLYGYLVFALIALIASGIRSIALLVAAVRAARVTFSKLIRSLSQAPMSWYDQTPAGRILNRVSSDQQRVDERVPQLLRDTMDTLLRVFGTVCLTAVFSPWFLLLLPVVSLFFYNLQLMYRRTTRELKRMDSTSRSPIYNNFSGALSGLDVLKASELCNLWMQKHHAASDDNFRFGYLVLTSSRWGSIRFEFIGHLLVIFVTIYISCVSAFGLIRHAGASESAGTLGMSPGLAGAALMNTLLVNRLLLKLTRSGVELEIGFNAMERLDFYATQLPSEAAETDAELGVSTEENWPSKGEVQFRELFLRYRPHLPDVLQGITVDIKGGEKIGVVGRTGSGKSTLTMALFRMVEARSGSIVIDGVDIATRGLSTLRSRIAIVPQAPTLFEGTIRYNLDPHGHHSDQKIWTALGKVQLRASIEDTGKGLNAAVEAGGLNWSVGQRQLLCLARAICTEAKILVLDECSASVDLQTDELLQEMIRKEFKSSTVFTIAHRLETVMHCDKVLVMDAGKVAEFDAPHSLIENSPDGIFAGFARHGLKGQ